MILRLIILAVIFSIVVAWAEQLSQEERHRLNEKALAASKRESYRKAEQIYTRLLNSSLTPAWRAGTLFNRAITRQKQDLIAEAAEDYKAALHTPVARRHRAHVYGRVMRYYAEVLCHQGHISRGLRMINRSLEFGNNTRAVLHRVACLLHGNRYDEAEIVIESTLRASSNLTDKMRVELEISFGMVLVKTGRYADVLAYMPDIVASRIHRSARRFAHEIYAETYTQLGRSEDALKSVDAALNLTRIGRRYWKRTMALKCTILLDAKRLDDALGCAENLGAQTEFHEEPHFWALGVSISAYTLREQWSLGVVKVTRALEWLERYGNLQRPLWPVVLQRADMLTRIGRDQEAIAYLDRLMELSEDQSADREMIQMEAKILRATVRRKTDPQGAINDLSDEIMKMNVETHASLMAEYHRAITGFLWDDNHVRPALQHVTAAVDLERVGDNRADVMADLLDSRASLLMSLNRIDEAIKDNADAMTYIALLDDPVRSERMHMTLVMNAQFLLRKAQMSTTSLSKRMAVEAAKRSLDEARQYSSPVGAERLAAHVDELIRGASSRRRS